MAAAGEDHRKLRSIARAFLEKCETGDIPAVKELADRLDGKVPQAVVGGDEDDNPINVLHRIERVIVRPPDQNG